MASVYPQLLLSGASHHTANLEIRERLAIAPDRQDEFNAELRRLPGVRESLVLSTCNRIEMYAFAEHPETRVTIDEFFCRFQGISVADYARYQLFLRDCPAVVHLLEVASGLDSQILGETEILGQLKSSYAAAVERGTLGPALNRIFQKAFQAAKWARTHTAIGSGQVSIANVAVDLALKIFGELSATRVLVLGAGEIGEKTAKALISRGAERFTVASRTFSRAGDLALSLGGDALPMENLASSLHRFDIVLASTASTLPILTREMVNAAVKRRPLRPIFLIDLAMPRDVEASVSTLSQVYLYNLDDLAKIAEVNREQRLSAVAECRRGLEQRANQIWEGLRDRRAGFGQNGETSPSSQPA
jgi:glutamyl-tRNA reductase